MSFTYDPSTDAGKVRMLCTDRDSANQIFSDTEIDAFLSMEGSSVRRAAALALETIASNEALTQKVIVTLDIETDGAKVSDALLKRAAALRTQEDNTGAFAIAESVNEEFGYRERLEKEALRAGV